MRTPSRATAARAAAAGVEFRYGSTIAGIAAAGDAVRRRETGRRRYGHGQSCAPTPTSSPLGSYSPLLLRPLVCA